MSRLNALPATGANYPVTAPMASIPPAAVATSNEPTHRVWLRRTGVVCKVRVESRDAALWLRGQLSTGFSCSDPEPVPGGSGCTFRIALGLSTSFPRLQRTIEELPAATLMIDPA